MNETMEEEDEDDKERYSGGCSIKKLTTIKTPPPPPLPVKALPKSNRNAENADTEHDNVVDMQQLMAIKEEETIN